MTRWEFIRRLEELLSDIAPSEREEALQYYNDYFNDAGKGNEEQTIAELGSPEEVAKTVKEGLGISTETEKSQNSTEEASKKAAENSSENSTANSAANGAPTYHPGTAPEYHSQEEKKNDIPGWGIALIIVGCIILIPVVVPLLAGIFGTLVGIFFALLGIIVAFALTAIALAVAAIVLLIAGIPVLFTSPLVGMALIGAALLCAAFATAALLFTVFMCGTVLPGMCRGIAYIWKKLFGKKEA